MITGYQSKRIDWQKYELEIKSLEDVGNTRRVSKAIIDDKMEKNPEHFLMKHDTRLSIAQSNSLRCLHKLLDTLTFPSVMRHDFQWLHRCLHRHNSNHPNYKKIMLILNYWCDFYAEINEAAVNKFWKNQNDT